MSNPRLKSYFFRLTSFLVGLFLVGLTTLIPSVTLSFPPSNNPQLLLEQGRQFYEQEQFNRALEIWQQGEQIFQQQGDSNNQALSLNYLSLAYQALGQWDKAQKTIEQSLELLKSSQPPNSQTLRAKALNTLGSLQLAQGQTQAALISWQEAETLYTQIGDEIGHIGTQINQAQALQQLGFYRRSADLLTTVSQYFQSQPDSSLKAMGLRNFANVLMTLGELEKAKEILQQSLAISQHLKDQNNQAATLLSLGNLMSFLDKAQQALINYQKAAEIAPDSFSQLKAQINQLDILIKQQQWSDAKILISQIQPQLSNLTPSRRNIYIRVHFVSILTQADPLLNDTLFNQLVLIIAQGVKQAETLKDFRAQSYSLGTLGTLYELKKQGQEAQILTEKAIKLASTISAEDILYQWQWQLARILEAQGNYPQAIATNTLAVNTLQTLRKDLVSINPELQFSFRESVEPVYRNLIRLLLIPESQSEQISQSNLIQARQVLESLQLAELENFFREACINAIPKQIEQIDPTAAVISAIILTDRLGVILSLPGQPLRYYETVMPKSKIENTLDQLLQSLNPAFSNQIRLQLSQQVYNWLIAPAEKVLEEANIETLVFVLDGILRNLPMSALYDGQNYLVENYKIALTPGLQLLDPQALVKRKLKAVLAGVSEENQGFSPLPGVKVEITEISQEIISTSLLNQEFTRSNFQQQLEKTPFPIIHLATHGQFSSDPEETFVLAWQDTIKVKDLQNLLRYREQQITNPVELLVLSACQTATGDQQAVLGLAGMAVRSGARSTIATLWAVRDQSTAQFMTEFYRFLSGSQPQMSKAEALRQAQLTLINSPQFNHPFYWSAFVLVGNWL